MEDRREWKSPCLLWCSWCVLLSCCVLLSVHFLRMGITAESHPTCSPQVVVFPEGVTRSIPLSPQRPTTS